LLLTRHVFFLVVTWLAMAGVCFAQPVANSGSAPDKAPEAVLILVPPTVLDTLKVFLRPGETPDTFDDFAREGNYRDLTDYLLLRRALVVGGNSLPVAIEPWLDVSYDRVILRLRAGHAAVFSNGIWREDIPLGDAQLKVSPPLFEYGEMEAGIYMSPHNQKLHSTRTRADVQKLSAVSSKQWRPDWIALQQLGLDRLYDNVYWESMLKMVRSERVDFMLIGFSNSEDLSYNAVGITLKPVPNMKVKLAGSRGWVISQTNPQGALAYQAIEKGLGILRSTGVIKRAYRDAGVINTAVENWLVLNPMAAAVSVEQRQ
jgi:hypothetical protein